MNCRENSYIGKIRKNGTLPKYEMKNVSYVSTNKRKRFFQVSPITSNDQSEYVENLPFRPLSPKVQKKKKKRRRSRKKEEMLSSPMHYPHINFFPKGFKSFEDDELDCIHYYLEAKSVGTIEDDFDPDLHVINYIDHDWENNDITTYNLENLFGTNHESN